MLRRVIAATALSATALCAGLSVVGVSVAGLSPAVALAHRAHAADVSPRASLTALRCHRALDPAARYVSVTAVMRPLPGTQGLAVKFRLLRRPRGARGFTRLSAPGLGTWITPSDPTLGRRPGDVWRVIHPVADLGAPAAYRLEVRFRWTGAGGQVIGTATRTTRTCFEPELRPDLVVSGITVQADAAHPNLDDYLAHVANTGRTAAGAFDVRFIDGSVEHDATLPGLAAGDARTVRFVGPACDPTAPPTVTADPNDTVDVSSRDRASLTATCPPA